MQLLRKACSCVNEITARMSSFHALLLGLSLGGLDADLLVILLKGGEILTGLGEFSLLHALSDVPMDEGSLGVHEIELVVNAGEDFGNGGRVGDHADGAHNLGELLVVGLLGGDDGSVRGEHEMDPGVGDKVGLEFSDINVEGTVESEGGGEGRDDLGDQSVQVGVGGPLDVEVSTADVVHGLVVEHDGDVGVLEERVGRQDGVVRLNDGGGDLRGGVDGESELGFLSVIDGESLEEEGSETGTGTATNGVEDEETLETSALIGELADSVEAEIDDLTSDGVMSTGEVVEGIVTTTDSLIGGHLAIGLNSVLEA